MRELTQGWGFNTLKVDQEGNDNIEVSWKSTIS